MAMPLLKSFFSATFHLSDPVDKKCCNRSPCNFKCLLFYIIFLHVSLKYNQYTHARMQPHITPNPASLQTAATPSPTAPLSAPSHHFFCVRPVTVPQVNSVWLAKHRPLEELRCFPTKQQCEQTPVVAQSLRFYTREMVGQDNRIFSFGSNPLSLKIYYISNIPTILAPLPPIKHTFWNLLLPYRHYPSNTSQAL